MFHPLYTAFITTVSELVTAQVTWQHPGLFHSHPKKNIFLSTTNRRWAVTSWGPWLCAGYQGEQKKKTPSPGDSKWPFYPLVGGYWRSPTTSSKGSRFHSPFQKGHVLTPNCQGANNSEFISPRHQVLLPRPFRHLSQHPSHTPPSYTRPTGSQLFIKLHLTGDAGQHQQGLHAWKNQWIQTSLENPPPPSSVWV